MNDPLFVYGTLMPGGSAWHVLEPYAVPVGAATTTGRLFDTGAGYPAAVFDPAGGTVHGIVVDVCGGEPSWHALDRYEGTGYRRIVVDTTLGRAAAYEWIASRRRLVPLESGRWGETPA